MSIKISNLSKNYGSQKAVNNISFSIGKGEVVGFLGPNGAGKSTTMKIITGYLSGDGGEVEVCNENGGRGIIPFNGMLPGDAYLWSKYRDDKLLLEKFNEFNTSQQEIVEL